MTVYLHHIKTTIQSHDYERSACVRLLVGRLVVLFWPRLD